MMQDEYIDFKKRQREMRESFDTYLTLPEVRKILGLSYERLIGMIRDGELPAIKVAGGPIRRYELTEDTHSIRILPSDLQAFIDRARIN